MDPLVPWNPDSWPLLIMSSCVCIGIKPTYCQKYRGYWLGADCVVGESDWGCRLSASWLAQNGISRGAIPCFKKLSCVLGMVQLLQRSLPASSDQFFLRVGALIRMCTNLDNARLRHEVHSHESEDSFGSTIGGRPARYMRMQKLDWMRFNSKLSTSLDWRPTYMRFAVSRGLLPPRILENRTGNNTLISWCWNLRITMDKNWSRQEKCENIIDHLRIAIYIA